MFAAFRRVLVPACCSLAFVSLAAAQSAEPSRIAVISAFEPELTKLLAATQVTERRVINGRTHYLGILAGQRVVLLLSGMSIVNATMVTQALVDKIPVSAIVFSGIAGGVNPSLHVGDVTVPAEWGNYQEQVFARRTTAGWDSSNTAGAFPNFGMMFPRGLQIVSAGGTPDATRRRFWFNADSSALDRARAVARSVRLDRCTAAGACLEHEPRIVVGGRGVSGSTFVDNAAYREYVWKTFHADALDMETAAVAVVAFTNHIPFVAFRSLSDLAGGGSGSNEVRTFGRLAADNSAAVVIAYLNSLTLR
jgi:adenosylhomocysteine nucleosidase